MKLTEAGHIKICQTIQPKIFWLAWGESSTDLSSTPENLENITLEDEVGRTKQSYNSFVIPDGSGSIEVGGQTWSPSVSPTKYLYLKFEFPQNANTDKIIRQMGLFTDVVLSTGAENVLYIDTSTDKTNQMDNIGELFEIMNQSDITRDSSTQEKYDIIITF